MPIPKAYLTLWLKYSAPPNPNAPKARLHIHKFLRLKCPAIAFKFDYRHSRFSVVGIRAPNFVIQNAPQSRLGT